MHRRRVAVRVVIDKDYLDINGSQVGRLLKAGISVRHDTGSYFMHHKFALVDGRLLLTGSLNWTMTAVQGNRENVLVTEDPAFVKPFLREFEELWTANDPAAPAPTLA
ncbi:PLD6 hydrolase, partial [Amia calva]|nr:PLD6 hydrolase [Amia calva]